VAGEMENFYAGYRKASEEPARRANTLGLMSRFKMLTQDFEISKPGR
jgi:hypothetical protein